MMRYWAVTIARFRWCCVDEVPVFILAEMGVYGIVCSKEMKRVDHRHITLGEESHRIPLVRVRSKRSRYLRAFLLSSGRVRISVPWCCSIKETEDFIRKNEEWILSQWLKYKERQSLFDFLVEYPCLSIEGGDYELIVETSAGRPFFIQQEASKEVLFRIRGGDTREEDIYKLCFDLAKLVVPRRVKSLADTFGFRYSRVSVRNQSTRWGSCSTTGTLSLNWRLLLLPAVLQDHVILHELAHTREMNHSHKFWQLLTECDPRTKDHNKSLHRESKRLFGLVC